MNALLYVSGKVYWLLWPVFFLLLRRTERTRILVIHENTALVVKTWFSDGKWTLPGGGIHRGESVREATARELYEEVGITLDRTILKTHGKVDYKKRGISTRLVRFSARLPERPQISRQWYEITHAEWVALSTLHHGNTDASVLEHIEAWQATP